MADETMTDQRTPNRVPMAVDVNQHASIFAVFEEASSNFADQPAFSSLGTTLSYKALDGLARDFAAYLQNLPGMKKGDRVALMMPNLLQYPVALLGAIRAGFVLVNIDPQSPAPELEHQLRDSGAKAIVVYESQAHVLEQVLKKTPLEHIVLASFGETHGFFKRLLLGFSVGGVKKPVPAFKLAGAIAFKKTLALGRSQELHKVNITRDDLAFLQYTRASAGAAKGAMLTQGNVVANLQQVAVCLAPCLEAGKGVAAIALPMHQILCITANVLLMIQRGGHCLLIPDASNMKAVVKALRAVPFNVLTVANNCLDSLLSTAGFEKIDFSHVKLLIGDATAIEPAQAEKWHAATRTRFSRVYGLAEASPVVCFNPVVEVHDGCVGQPVPFTETSIRDQSFHELPVGQQGELCVKGPQVMRGYWSKPRETAEVLTQDGWLKTGDLAYKDQNGCVYLVGRIAR